MGAALGALLPTVILAPPALAQEQTIAFDIPAQPLSGALNAYAREARRQILFSDALVQGRQSAGLQGRYEATAALERLLDGSGLTWRRSASGALLIERAADRPQALAPAPDVGAAARPTDVEALVVTGTNIRSQTEMVQVTQISREALQRGGYNNIGDALQKLPVNFSGGINIETLAGGVQTDYASFNRGRGASVNLRGLGSGATLVLFNGNRLPLAGEGISSDVSLIPIAAVERIDVLADGASAIYGADAVAGVVNIVTRRRFDGLEGRARYGAAEKGLETWAGSLLGGASVGRLSGLAGVEYVEQGKLWASERKASRLRDQPQTLFTDTAKTSYFGSLTFEARPDLRLLADAVYAQNISTHERSTTASTNRAGFTDRKTSQYSISTGVLWDVSSRWRLEATATTSGSLLKTLTLNTRTGFPSTQNAFRYDYEVWTSDLRASGELLTLPSGPVDAAVGISYREEDAFLLGSAVPRTVEREVASIYGELVVPLVRPDPARLGFTDLRITFAGRVDDYSDFGRASAPRVGVRWAPHRDLRVDASYSSSFRAPSPFDSVESYYTAYQYTRDNVPAGRSLALVVFGTGRTLEPETSDNLNLSLTWEPARAPGLRVALGYYKVDYRDRISYPDPTGQRAADVLSLPAFMVERNPSQARIAEVIAAGVLGNTSIGGAPLRPDLVTVLIDSRVANIARSEIEGYQASASWRRDLGPGELTLSLDLNYIASFKEQLALRSTLTSRVDTINSPADLKSRLGASWTSGRWSAAGYWNYVDNYVDNRIPSRPQKVDAWNTVDANLQLRLGDAATAPRLTISANNLFDAKPPRVAPLATNRSLWDPTNASIVGRFVSVEISKTW